MNAHIGSSALDENKEAAAQIALYAWKAPLRLGLHRSIRGTQRGTSPSSERGGVVRPYRGEFYWSQPSSSCLGGARESALLIMGENAALPTGGEASFPYPVFETSVLEQLGCGLTAASAERCIRKAAPERSPTSGSVGLADATAEDEAASRWADCRFAYGD
jgi:hypothetical protein